MTATCKTFNNEPLSDDERDELRYFMWSRGKLEDADMLLNSPRWQPKSIRGLIDLFQALENCQRPSWFEQHAGFLMAAWFVAVIVVVICFT